jgi:hypothetical protein
MISIDLISRSLPALKMIPRMRRTVYSSYVPSSAREGGLWLSFGALLFGSLGGLGSGPARRVLALAGPGRWLPQGRWDIGGWRAPGLHGGGCAVQGMVWWSRSAALPPRICRMRPAGSPRSRSSPARSGSCQ